MSNHVKQPSVVNDSIRHIIEVIETETSAIQNNSSSIGDVLQKKIEALQSYFNNINNVTGDGIEITQETNGLILTLHDVVINNIAVLSAYKKVSEYTLSTLLSAVNIPHLIYDRPSKSKRSQPPIKSITLNELC